MEWEKLVDSRRHHVKYCPNAPPINYEYDPNSNGTPEQWQKNLRQLQVLKPLAGRRMANDAIVVFESDDEIYFPFVCANNAKKNSLWIALTGRRQILDSSRGRCHQLYTTPKARSLAAAASAALAAFF